MNYAKELWTKVQAKFGSNAPLVAAGAAVVAVVIVCCTCACAVRIVF